MNLERYRSRLLEREEARLRLAAAARLGDAFLTLSAAGPAPLWDPDAPEAASNLRPTGVPSFNMATSLLGLPAVTVPMLSVSGMPLGVQVVGMPHEDARTTSYARWIGQSIAPIAVV
jgi:Asp-tRNA(Asn)/Glu-tRNA(Gln) amidotransferase A subunit family amidase